MSSLDSDHNQSASLDQHQSAQSPACQPSTRATAFSDTDIIPPLPAYVYNPTSNKRPLVSTSFEHSIPNGQSSSTSRDEDSPDPHDFYRRHQDPNGRGMTEGLGQGDIRVEKRSGGSAGLRYQHRPSPVSARNNGPNLPFLSSHVSNVQYTSSPTSQGSPLSAAKSSSALSSTARNRQTSLKDLVNRFNQIPDEVPPLPRKSMSRSPSSGSNPSTHSSRVPTLSQSKNVGESVSTKGLSPGDSASSRPARFQQRRGRTHEDPKISPRSRRNQKTQQTVPLDSRSYASQSLTDLAPDIGALPRRPLFGEVLNMDSTHPDVGYGILAFKRRRGSEGSMHSPNPMFPEERHRYVPGVSPLSPTAWYMGATPTLEEIKAEKSIPERPTNTHLRTLSDCAGAPSRPPTSRIYGAKPSPPSTPKRNSQSRIPISTRRLSTASDSGNSTPSTRNNSALGRAQMKSPTKASASASKPRQNLRSPPRHSRSSTPQRSPRRGEYSTATQRPAISPRLTAYISAPMPKKSPPLRSSRPRQPVSSASTSASRARAVDRLSGHENGGLRSTRDNRPRKPPELGGVDFAARRQKIQQAFTKTVKENERQEVEAEQRRVSMIHDGRSTDGLFIPETAHESEPHQDDAENLNREGEKAPVIEEESFQTPAQELPNSEQELTINTAHLSERSVLDLSMEDSPTLGTYHRFSSNTRPNRKDNATPSSDAEPSSAITAHTSDSLDTFFDDEPQEDSAESSRRPSRDHKTLLSQIMRLRDERSASPESIHRSVAREESASEKDEQESIQIMLGETPVLEKATFTYQYEAKPQDPRTSEGPDNRWSVASWTSSNRSKDDRDGPMERIDEHSPPRSQHPVQATHLSISTCTSEHTQLPWSPASFSSPKTARTTMDSDAYSTINRVLDHYHDPSVVSSELMHDVQQHIFTQSPDLARQGGWDPKKVTQLYLQELARGRYAQSSAMPDPLKFQIKRRTSSLAVPPPDPQPVAEKEVSTVLDEKMVQRIEHSRNTSSTSAVSLQVDENDTRHARASLSRADDWDISPSLGELQLQAEAIYSPVDDQPMLPLKDWGTAKKDLAEMSDHNPDDKGVSAGELSPKLPPIEGLGIEINVLSPEGGNSAREVPPPLPGHSPPPPPVNGTDHMRSPLSPNTYNKHVPTNSDPSKTSNTNTTNTPLVADDSSRRSRSGPSSLPPSLSSSGSQDPPSNEAASVPTEATSKNSSPSPDQKRLTRRRHIIKELVDTEHSFGQDMKVVDDIYKGTSNVIIISAEDVKTLFSNSDQIVTFSTHFLDALKQASKPVYVLPKSKRWRSNRVSNATSYSGNTDDQSSINGMELTDDDKDRKTSVGEAYGQHMASMEKVYSDYLKNHDAANQKLQLLQKNPKVQIWLKECRAYAHDLTSAWDLDSLLVKPVQRILKYPLLLDQLLEVTPENHPDYTALDVAARGMKGMSVRLNEMKKRADILEQVTSNRKRKESDVRIGLSKAFGRRTEKLRQQVGLSDLVEDKPYAVVSEKFGSHFFQLQVVMRDVEMYTNDVQIFMNRFSDFASAIEAYIEVSQSSYVETDSKWRKFRMLTREIAMTALPDHIAAVRKSVVEPMTTLLKLHDGPQKLMQKRSKRIMDYARFKAIKDRGDKPDKKTTEQGEQFMAVNDTLKEELPKLFVLTGKLVEACLNNFVQLQFQWQRAWRVKLRQVLGDESNVPSNTQQIVDSFTSDVTFFETQLQFLGICNGSLVNDVANLVSFLSPSTTSNATTLNGDEAKSSRETSSLEFAKRRTLSISSDKSPQLPRPDFGGRTSGSFFSVGDAVQMVPGPPNQVESDHRMRASSNISGKSGVFSVKTPEVPGSYRSYSNSTTPVNSTPGRPLTAATARTFTDPSSSYHRSSTEVNGGNQQSDSSAISGRPPSGKTYPPITATYQPRSSSPPARNSGVFSSAMPMSDSPRSESPLIGQGQQDYNVIFLAASVYEFSIDRARKEAGFPYLTYVAGEIFDVIAEKGELWLAKNQDDSTNLVGWIWNKHFVKLAS